MTRDLRLARPVVAAAVRRPRRRARSVARAQREEDRNQHQHLAKETKHPGNFVQDFQNSVQTLSEAFVRMQQTSTPAANDDIAQHHHGFQEWSFRAHTSDVLEISERHCPHQVEFYLCRAHFFDENPFRTRAEIAAECRLVRQYARPWPLRAVMAMFQQSVAYEHFSFMARDVFPVFEKAEREQRPLNAAEQLAMAAGSYRLVAVFERSDKSMQIRPSPAFTLRQNDEGIWKIAPCMFAKPLINYKIMAERLREFDGITGHGQHRLTYQIQGTEDAETIQALLSVAELHPNALFNACEQNDPVLVRLMLEHGAAINNDRGHSPMHHCSKLGSVDLMQVLTKFRADVNKQLWDGSTPLHVAAKHDQLASAQFLIQHGAHINHRDIQNRTALHFAAQKGNLAMAELLLQSGADVDAVATGGMTPLLWATAGKHASQVHLLLEHGAQVNVHDAKGATPLLVACSNGDVPTARALLDAGALANIHGPNGDTPLIVASKGGYAELVRLLLDSTVDPALDAQNGWHDTALIAAICGTHSVEIASLLLDHGAQTDLADNLGDTALTHAAAINSPAIVQLLVERGANVDHANNGGDTALFNAVRNKNWPMTYLLLSTGRVDVFRFNDMGETVFDLAASAGNPELYRMLNAYRVLSRGVQS